MAIASGDSNFSKNGLAERDRYVLTFAASGPSRSPSPWRFMLTTLPTSSTFLQHRTHRLDGFSRDYPRHSSRRFACPDSPARRAASHVAVAPFTLNRPKALRCTRLAAMTAHWCYDPARHAGPGNPASLIVQGIG